MCCVLTLMTVLGARGAFLIFWLAYPVRVYLAFGDLALPWLVGVLGLAFVPWTMLVYVLVFPMNGFDWVWVGLALGADIASYIGSYQNRQRIPGYPGGVTPQPPII